MPKKQFAILWLRVIALLLLLRFALPIAYAAFHLQPPNPVKQVTGNVKHVGQHVFLSWDSKTKTETMVIQPTVNSTSKPFTLLIPTPNKPKFSTVSQNFFKHLDVYTTLYKRGTRTRNFWTRRKTDLLNLPRNNKGIGDLVWAS